MDSAQSADSPLDHAVRSIDSGELLANSHDKILLLRNFFDSATLAKIRGFIHSNICWTQENHQEHLPRLTSQVDGQDLQKELFQTIYDRRILKALESKTGQRLECWGGLSIWKDLPGFEIGLHVDNANFHCAIQIYLGEDFHPDLGTTFMVDGKARKIPYAPNCGYFLGTANVTAHGLLTPVSEGFQRFSLYVRYRNQPEFKSENSNASPT